MNFVHDYRRDLERYHIQHASQSMDEYSLKNFDWTVRVKFDHPTRLFLSLLFFFQMAVHDEHLFKCRLPLLHLQLQLTNGNQSKNLLLELDEDELTRLIDQMTQIEQVTNDFPYF